MTQHPGDADLEPHFLTDWESAQVFSKTRNARIASVVLHAALIVTLLSLPKSVTTPVTHAIERKLTPLIAPFTELTQTAPNRGKVNKEFNVESVAPRPRLRIPPAPPPGRKLALPAEKKPAPVPAPAALPDVPKLETAQQTPPVNAPPIAAPPQIQQQERPVEKPKLAFETPPPVPTGPGTGKLAKPSTSVQDALNSVTQGGAGGALIVGDPGAISPSATGGLNAPPIPGKPGASLELLSNTQGADFRPYLIQVLQKVKLNWFNVWPQSARMGRQGRVVIQFAIDRHGNVPKLVIPSGSGTEALDRAAIAGISASQPFPQFPTGFTGEQIRLQLNFVYNMR